MRYDSPPQWAIPTGPSHDRTTSRLPLRATKRVPRSRVAGKPKRDFNGFHLIFLLRIDTSPDRGRRDRRERKPPNRAGPWRRVLTPLGREVEPRGDRMCPGGTAFERGRRGVVPEIGNT
jgi:hypothetical protein